MNLKNDFKGDWVGGIRGAGLDYSEFRRHISINQYFSSDEKIIDFVPCMIMVYGNDYFSIFLLYTYT